MDAQYVVLIAIVASALVYIGSLAWKRIRSFSPKTGCEADCGCSSVKKKRAL